MTGDTNTSSLITSEDVQAMRSWFSSHRDNSHNGAKNLEEYVTLVRIALKANNKHFLGNALRFCKGVGQSGFEKVLAIPDLTHLTTVVK